MKTMIEHFCTKIGKRRITKIWYYLSIGVTVSWAYVKGCGCQTNYASFASQATVCTQIAKIL